MLKNSAVNAKIARPVGSKRIEKPIKIEKSSKKHDEIKEKSKSSSVVSSGKTVATTKKISSSHETSTTTKPQIIPKTISTKPKQTTTVAPTIGTSSSNTRTKINNVATNKVIRGQPMKAVHQVQAKKPVAEKNVMNTIHNVTVASPPPVRKEVVLPQATVEILPRERTKTRTLEPEEVLILKQAKTEQHTPNSSDSNPTRIEPKSKVVHEPVAEPVAFEITFDKASTSQKIDTNNKQDQGQDRNISDVEYEDDFDSYESDFETESAASSHSASLSSNSDSRSNSSSPTESRQVHSPVKKLDDERDFDSGTYELKGVADKLQLDSIDERESHSEGQNDSGFGYNNSTPSPVEQTQSISSSIYSKPIIKSTYSKRGMELMKKINLDTMTFTLFELKPISYDIYMKVYGHKNTNQSSTQTIGDMINQDVQTDKKTKQSMWTQFPPNFVANVVLNENYHQDRVGCGEGIDEVNEERNDGECVLENTLKVINKNNVVREVPSTKPIDYERLNFFLQKSAVTLSAICGTSGVMRDLHKSDLSLSDGFFQISVNASKILHDTVVYYMFSNPRIENFVYFVHRQKVSSKTDDNSIVSVWNILDTKKPIHVLSCWSSIVCLEVHHLFQDVVIGGLTDGCLAVWNFSESTFWHQNIENESVLVPTHIVSPTLNTKLSAFDFGCVVSLKSVHAKKTNEDDFNLTQICSLHEFGIVTIWNILKTNSYFTHADSSNELKIDHRSPWSKIQLIQSNIIDLGSVTVANKIRPKSGFEKKKMYFESNLFSDAALRELHDFDAQKDLLNQSEGLRCTDLEYHEDGIIIATNKSFLILIPTSLSRDSLRKLIIDDSNFLHATKLKSMEEVLLVGLTDGTVKVLRVRPSNSNIHHKLNNNDSFTPGVPLEDNNFSAKSCAIQNIIKEERKNFDECMSKDRLKQVQRGLVGNETVLLGYRFMNNQVLLPAMSLNRDFVRWLDVSANLNCLMGLCGERLRIVNFPTFIETQENDGHNGISYATIVLGYNNREYLVNVRDDDVRVYLLRKKMS